MTILIGNIPNELDNPTKEIIGWNIESTPSCSLPVIKHERKHELRSTLLNIKELGFTGFENTTVSHSQPHKDDRVVKLRKGFGAKITFMEGL